MAATEPTHHSFDDLVVWRTSLPDVQHALLPPSSDRPNPRMADGILYVSVFAPGRVYALDAASGEICWRHELPNFGASSVEVAGDILLVRTAQTLYALDPRSGKTRWEFCPHGSGGETIYSEPVLDGRRLFIGDRRGWLHCLSVDTGQTIWKQQTSGAFNCDVNATGTVVAGLLIVATNAGLALAFSAENGRPVWHCKLDGPCINHMFVAAGQVVAAAESLYFLTPTTGQMQERVHWPGLAVAFAAGTPSQVVLFRRPSWDELEKHNEVSRRRPEAETLFLFEGTRLTREIQCSGYASAVRFSPATGLLYAAGLSALDILNPATGAWLHTLRPDEATSGHGFGLPDVAGNNIYAVDGKGVVSSMQHPA